MFDSMNKDGVSLLLRLLAAHFSADFILQAGSWVQDRRKRRWASPLLYVHAALAGLLVYAFAGHWPALWLPAVIFVSHAVLDGLKSGKDDSHGLFLLDQAGHLLILTGCWMALTRKPVADAGVWISELVSNPAFWVLALSYILVVWPAGVWIRKATEPWWKDLTGKSRVKGLEEAGLWIGRLERILILTFILLSHVEAIGFLIAAKSILRFGDLRRSNDRKEAEYVLIGTMFRILFALIVGIGAKWVLSKYGFFN